MPDASGVVDSARLRSTRIPRVYATPREAVEWETCIDGFDDEVRHYRTRWYWVSVNHYRDGGELRQRWGSWAAAMRYCLLLAPNSALDAAWRQSVDNGRQAC